jgi:hypothetical protein
MYAGSRSPRAGRVPTPQRSGRSVYVSTSPVNTYSLAIRVKIRKIDTDRALLSEILSANLSFFPLFSYTFRVQSYFFNIFMGVSAPRFIF